VPNDVSFVPKVFLVGKSKTGKSILAKDLEARLGLVRLKLSTILEIFVKEHRCLLTDQALQLLESGESLPDELLIDLVLLRTSMADCLARGWVLDGFPKDKTQAQLFTSRGLVPSCVLSLHLERHML